MMPEIKPFKIRDIEINPPLMLSPMAGVTDVSFRRLLKRRGGVGLSVSEFISVEGLTRNNPKSKRQMRFYEDERPFAVQIFGGQPERMRMAAEMAEEVGADILDINCGCPAPKVVKHGGGSGLLKDHSRLETDSQRDQESDHDSADGEDSRGLLRSHDQRGRDGEARRRLWRRAHRVARPHERTGLSRSCELGSGQADQGSGEGAGVRQWRRHDDRRRVCEVS